MFKNEANQHIVVYAVDTSAAPYGPKTGDAANITATISKDGGAPVATNDVNPTELGGGLYSFDLLQAETNADLLAFAFTSATPNVQISPIVVFTKERMRGTDNAALAAVCTEDRLAHLDADVSSRAAPGDKMDLINAPNATAIAAIQAGLALAAVCTEARLAHLDADVSSRAAPGDKMDLINAPNATAIAAIQAGLALASVCTEARLAHLDADVTSRAAPGDQMDLVDAPNATAIAAIQAGLALASVCTEDRLAHLDADVTSRAAPGDQMDLINAPNATAIAAIQAGLALAAVCTEARLARLDATISSRSTLTIGQLQTELWNALETINGVMRCTAAPGATRTAVLCTIPASGSKYRLTDISMYSFADATLLCIKGGNAGISRRITGVSTNGINITFTVPAFLYDIFPLDEFIVLPKRYVEVTNRVTLNDVQDYYAPAVAGDKMDLVDAPNATAIAALQLGLALATVCTEERLARLDANISSRSSHSAADVKTAVEAAGSHLAILKAIMEADVRLDTAGSPWQEVYYEKGTTNELLRKDLYDSDGDPITDITTYIAAKTQPAS